MGLPRRHQHDRAGRTLAAMYRDHATAAYRYAVHLTGSRVDADDLVQAAFLEAHRQLVGGGDIVNPRAWLATVVRTRASNLRRDSREAPASDQLDRLAGAVREEATDAREALDRVRAALYELPEAQHQAFVLRYWSDLSYREIAEVLETTESAVESLLVRARAAIVSGPELPEDCVETRRHLSADSVSAPALLVHLDGCARCRAARERFARAAGIAAALALVPRIHVAQALAATVPGFTTAAATGAGAGGTALATGKAGLAAKAAIATLAVAGSVALVHVHVHARVHRNERGAAPATRPPAAAAAARTFVAPDPPTPSEQTDTVSNDRGRQHSRKRGRTASSDGAGDRTTGGAQAGDTQAQDGSSDGNSQGQDESTGADSTSGSGDAGGGDSQGSSGSQDGSSQSDGASSGGSGNDDS